MEKTEYAYRIGRTVAMYDITEGGCYGASWGLTDLYPHCEKNLKSLLASGEDFRASWGCKKELRDVTLMRLDGVMHIIVDAWMDDLWESDDLIYDALWEATGLEQCLDDEVIKEIRDIAYEVGCDDKSSATWKGECTDWDELITHIENLEVVADKKLKKWYEALVKIVSMTDLRLESD